MSRRVAALLATVLVAAIATIGLAVLVGVRPPAGAPGSGAASAGSGSPRTAPDTPSANAQPSTDPPGGTAGSTPATPTGTAPVTPAASSPSARSSTAPTGTSPAGTAPSGVALEPSLLDILPKTVGASQVVRDPDAEGTAAAGPGLAANADALAAAVVGDDGENLATALLVEGRPETDMAAWFEAWRRDFDRAACEPIGGAGTPAREQIGGRAAWVTACGQGGSVYHVLVRGGRTILSVFELGPQRFGRQLLEHLRPGS